MNEQIQQTNRGQFNGGSSFQVRTGDAPNGAERKPMVSWAALLDEAVKKPGFIHEAYSRFHNYLLGNQLLALFQCTMRGIQPWPLATFPKWLDGGPGPLWQRCGDLDAGPSRTILAVGPR